MSAAPLKLVIDDTFGASFIGVLITAMLYGITTLQTYFFFIYYPKDRVENKLLVATIWILDTTHMIFASMCMYYYLITNYANPPALAFGHWSLWISVIMNVTIAFLVKCFFTIRIFRLSSHKVRWWLSLLIGLLVLAHFCFGIETVVFLFIKKELKKLPEITLFAAMPFALFAVLSDIFIAAALCILLHGSRTGFRRTNTLVNNLMVYAINRCVLTSVVATAEVITFAASPHSLWFLAIDFVVGKLYANSLLAHLNSRNSLRSAGSLVNSVRMSDIDFGPDSRPKDSTKGVVLDLRGEQTSRSSGSVARTMPSQDTSKDTPNRVELITRSDFAA
ncbi:hypothetical protein Hypma_000516 [Hypsizygus marmoreus]|uniref:DUF6534 domain-containing protein n=1 Tax=Hypsizygus marmoreus TaxID=39966 RepID=A0A369J8I2_HYPMA|nr:hypothetical protein Hypma_000516 [Hypsizygus marmoreus]